MRNAVCGRGHCGGFVCHTARHPPATQTIPLLAFVIVLWRSLFVPRVSVGLDSKQKEPASPSQRRRTSPNPVAVVPSIPSTARCCRSLARASTFTMNFHGERSKTVLWVGRLNRASILRENFSRTTRARAQPRSQLSVHITPRPFVPRRSRSVDSVPVFLATAA